MKSGNLGNKSKAQMDGALLFDSSPALKRLNVRK